MYYTTMLFDCDSRTFHALTEQAVYGFIKAEKNFCVNRIHKRMGAALRRLVDKNKAQGERIGGKKWLTHDSIKKILNCYGWALRSHRNDVPGMKRAVKTTSPLMSPTNDDPKHNLWLEGLESRCFYKRAVAKHEKLKAHKNSLPSLVYFKAIEKKKKQSTRRYWLLSVRDHKVATSLADCVLIVCSAREQCANMLCHIA